MPKDATDHRELDDDKALEALQKELPEGYGRIEYMIAFNAMGRDYIITRRGNRAEDLEPEDQDEVWKIVSDALALKRNEDSVSNGGSKSEYNHIRIQKTQDQDTTTVTVYSTDCRIDMVCPLRRIRIPNSRDVAHEEFAYQKAAE